MTTYAMIESLINEKIFATYNEAWSVIFNAYGKNKIDGQELEFLAELAKTKLNK